MIKNSYSSPNWTILFCFFFNDFQHFQSKTIIFESFQRFSMKNYSFWDGLPFSMIKLWQKRPKFQFLMHNLYQNNSRTKENKQINK